MKRIYVVEYSMLARNRIRQALSWFDDCQIIGEAEAANEGIDGVNDLDPDIVITDLAVEGRNGRRRRQADSRTAWSGAPRDLRFDQSPEPRPSRNTGGGGGERRIRQGA